MLGLFKSKASKEKSVDAGLEAETLDGETVEQEKKSFSKPILAFIVAVIAMLCAVAYAAFMPTTHTHYEAIETLPPLPITKPQHLNAPVALPIDSVEAGLEEKVVGSKLAMPTTKPAVKKPIKKEGAKHVVTAKTKKPLVKKQAKPDVLAFTKSAQARLNFSRKEATEKMRGKYLKARIERTNLSKELANLNKPAPKVVTFMSDPKKDGENANRANIEAIKVRSLVSQTNGVTAWIELNTQLVPVKLGSKIGNIEVIAFGDESVTFKAGRTTQTKWISMSEPPHINTGGKHEVTY